MKWFTSDLHIGHKNILKFSRDTRQGSDVEEMKELIVEAINSKVQRSDDLYLLGDVCFGNVKEACDFLDQINCKNLHLIHGNHDTKLITYGDFLQRFRSVNVYKEIKLSNDQKACMMHYPIAEWNRCHHGSYMLHGHTHGHYQGNGRIYDVGIDNRKDNLMLPYSEEELIELLDKREIILHNNKGSENVLM